MKKCHICGAATTLKGKPLDGDYCSPSCLDRARHRKFKTQYGGDVGSAGDSDETHSMSNIHNPFAKLFDPYGGD